MLELGLRLSPRTVGKYTPQAPDAGMGGRQADQRWATFIRNHAEVIVTCNFFVDVTATFKLLYV